MKIPIKIRLLLWLVNRDKSLQIHEMAAPKARASSEKKRAEVERFLDYPAVPLFNVFNKNISVRDGGGFVLRGIDPHDKACRRIARDNNAVVISVGYRLAPEYKFPVPVHDCYDATVWASENADVHKGDVSRMVVMGDSAGGSLATAVCLMSRDLNGPKIIYQVLIYPCTDGTLSSASIDEYGKGYLLTRKMMEWFMDHYKSQEEDLYSPYLSMLLADDLSNQPPAFIFTAEYDPLKDEGRKYAERLKEAGNEVIYKDYGGLIHGFINMPKLSKRIPGVYDDIRQVLEKVIA